jgi:acetylornithine deacetylase/succinyl-diaminopimelate desuccinylase-like protein
MSAEPPSSARIAPPESLGSSAVELTSKLIRFDTVNPPGNELPLQEFLLEMLESAGFECDLLESEPTRANLVARLPGNEPGKNLAFLAHVDTVKADTSDWQHDPWGGDLIDGVVWGRGAIDMKGQVSCEVSAAIALAEAGWRPPSGDLKLILTCDEETSGTRGAIWLCREHPELVQADYIVNEGGGDSFELDGQRFYGICHSEKGLMRFKVRSRGSAGHASQPAISENALIKLAPLITRFTEQPPPEPSRDGLAFLSAVRGSEVSPDEVAVEVERMRASDQRLVDYLVGPMLGITMSPTMVSASEKANVIPAAAEVFIDCRIPPECGEREARERAEALLGEGDYEIEFVEAVPGNSSEPESPLRDAIAEWIDEVDPGARVAPIATPFFSDSNAFRKAFPDSFVYGFFPRRDQGLFDAAPLMHAADERAMVSDLELAAEFFFDLPQRLMQPD